MSNTYCHENYCKLESNEEKTNYKNFLIIGGYVVFLLVTGALIVYGTSQGYYVDPALLM